MIVRDAKADEISFLQGKLAQWAEKGYEQFSLLHAIVFVAEDYDSLRAGMVCLRVRPSPLSLTPIWHIEPLILFPEFVKTSPGYSQRKATYLLAHAAEDYIADRARNTTGLHSFFCRIDNKNQCMQKWARHIGWVQVWPDCTFYGKDT